MHLNDVRVVVQRLGREPRVGRPQNALTDELHVVVLGNRQSERLTGPDVVERSLRGIQHAERFLSVISLEDLSTFDLPKRQDCVQVRRVHSVHVTHGEGIGSQHRIGVDVELDRVEIHVAHPPVRVPDEPGHVVLLPAVEHERTSAYRCLVERGILNSRLHVLKRWDVTQLPGHVEREVDMGTLQVEANGHIVNQLNPVVRHEQWLKGQRDQEISQLPFDGEHDRLTG